MLRLKTCLLLRLILCTALVNQKKKKKKKKGGKGGKGGKEKDKKIW
jgi:hypothetical protein